MDSMIIGRYLPLNSFIHKRDPRLRIGLLLLFLIAVFLMQVLLVMVFYLPMSFYVFFYLGFHSRML